MHEFRVRVGPAAFRVGSAWKAPIDALRRLYGDYPEPALVDFTVRLDPARPWRRYVRPSVLIAGDFMLPDAAPLPLAQGLLAAEMGMNMQMALGWRRHLLLHAGAAEKDGRALVMTGHSGSGKSTMAALLGEGGWRFMSDEFALLDLGLGRRADDKTAAAASQESGAILPFPRLVSLKNEGIGAMEQRVPHWRLGPRLRGTPKGDVRHLVPPAAAIAKMDVPAAPRLIVFPRFGEARAVRTVAPGELFMRLTQASTNYVALGQAGFAALAHFCQTVPARAIDYRNGEEGVELIERLWEEAP